MKRPLSRIGKKRVVCILLNVGPVPAGTEALSLVSMSLPNTETIILIFGFLSVKSLAASAKSFMRLACQPQMFTVKLPLPTTNGATVGVGAGAAVTAVVAATVAAGAVVAAAVGAAVEAAGVWGA